MSAFDRLISDVEYFERIYPDDSTEAAHCERIRENAQALVKGQDHMMNLYLWAIEELRRTGYPDSGIVMMEELEGMKEQIAEYLKRRESR